MQCLDEFANDFPVLSLCFTLISVTALVYFLVLAGRLVRAAERIADKIESG